MDKKKINLKNYVLLIVGILSNIIDRFILRSLNIIFPIVYCSAGNYLRVLKTINFSLYYNFIRLVCYFKLVNSYDIYLDSRNDYILRANILGRDLIRPESFSMETIEKLGDNVGEGPISNSDLNMLFNKLGREHNVIHIKI